LSIYDNPQEYANKTRTTLKQAIIRCQHFKKIEAEIQKARKCPKCGKETLEFEGGSCEEGYSDYIYCTNEVPVTGEDCNDCNSCKDHGSCFVECDFTSDVTEQYKPLSDGYDFDIVLYLVFGIEQYGMESVEKQIGCSWLQFVDRDNWTFDPRVFHCPRCGKIEIPGEIPTPDYCPECGSPPPGIWNWIKTKVLQMARMERIPEKEKVCWL